MCAKINKNTIILKQTGVNMIMRKISIHCFMLIILMLVGLQSSLYSQDGDVSSVEDFTLKDYEGSEHSLSDFKDSKAIVIIFIATECPISNDYNSRMEAIYNDYKDKDVAYIGINPNKAENVERIKEHAAQYGLTFPILKDEKNIIADRFKASVTPEVYVLNSNFQVLYHGRIDNSRKESEVETQDLRNALDEILSGREVSKTKTKAFGCTIKRI
jgi:peroxiredoxin